MYVLRESYRFQHHTCMKEGYQTLVQIKMFLGIDRKGKSQGFLDLENIMWVH